MSDEVQVNKFSPESLRSSRQRRGLSVRELADSSELRVSMIRAYERGMSKPCKATLLKLYAVLGEDIAYVVNTAFIFTVDHSYSITDKATKYRQHAMISPISGCACIFRYKGKDGIHHVFTEVKGGWTRTYTDAQLIGKLIKEVSHEQQT